MPPPPDPGERSYTFPYESTLHDVVPRLHDAQNAWLASIDSIEHLDRRTHELIRLVCTAILRHPEGCARHARLAREAGASWEQIVSALTLTEPAFGLLPAVSALEHARAGYEAAAETETDD